MTAAGSPPTPRPVDDVVEAALVLHRDTPGALLPIFHAIQDELGYIPPESLPRIASAVNQSRAEVHGVLSFYHDFRTAPPGRHVVKLCRAEACKAVGCDEVAAHAQQRLGIGFGETRVDGSVTLEAVYCLGNCALGPSAMIDGRLHGRVTAPRLDALLMERGARS